MTNKEFKEMVTITKRLSELIKKYEADFAEDEEMQPILVPNDVYSELASFSASTILLSQSFL